jgi:hypothetical protein
LYGLSTELLKFEKIITSQNMNKVSLFAALFHQTKTIQPV